MNHTYLWQKLIASNINGKVLKVIQNPYRNANLLVEIMGFNLIFFYCNVVVRQGENLSPILFALFINDFEKIGSSNYKGLNDLSTSIQCHLSNEDTEVFVRFFCLLYADDTVVLAENENDLQTALTSVKHYCDLWHLAVNTKKTKVVIFSRGKVRRTPVFYFGKDKVDVVDDYTYLEPIFNSNNKF